MSSKSKYCCSNSATINATTTKPKHRFIRTTPLVNSTTLVWSQTAKNWPQGPKSKKGVPSQISGFPLVQANYPPKCCHTTFFAKKTTNRSKRSLFLIPTRLHLPSSSISIDAEGYPEHAHIQKAGYGLPPKWQVGLSHIFWKTDNKN
jgi:hypothetical protein